MRYQYLSKMGTLFICYLSKLILSLRLLIFTILVLCSACSKKDPAQQPEEPIFALADPEKIFSLTRESENWRHEPLIRQALLREIESTIQATFQYYLWIFNANGLKLLEAQYSSSELQVSPLTIQVSDTGIDVIEAYLLRDKQRIVISLGLLHTFSEYYAEIYQPKASADDQQFIEKVIVFNSALNFVLHHELNHYYLDDVGSSEKLTPVFTDLFQLGAFNSIPDRYQLNEVRADYFAVLFTLLFHDCYTLQAGQEVTFGNGNIPNFNAIYPVRLMNKLATENPEVQGGINHIPWERRVSVLEGVLDYWSEKTVRSESFQCRSYGDLSTKNYSLPQGKSAKEVLEELVEISWGVLTDPTEVFLGFNRHSKVSDFQMVFGTPSYEEKELSDNGSIIYQEYNIPKTDSDIKITFDEGRLTRISLRTFSPSDSETLSVIEFLNSKGLDSSFIARAFGLEADQVEQNLTMLMRSDHNTTTSFTHRIREKDGSSLTSVQITCREKLNYKCSVLSVGF